MSDYTFLPSFEINLFNGHSGQQYLEAIGLDIFQDKFDTHSHLLSLEKLNKYIKFKMKLRSRSETTGERYIENDNFRECTLKDFADKNYKPKIYNHLLTRICPEISGYE